MRRREQIQVVVAGNGIPTRLCWQGQWVKVECLINAWVVQGLWWSTEVRREYVRLLTAIGAVEIYRQGEHWWFSRTLD